MDLTTKAEALARAAHEGQVDKSGAPYATHPERVAARVSEDDELVAIAWLHDVVEDTPITLDDLRGREFPESVVAAVDALTKRAGESKEGLLRPGCGQLACPAGEVRRHRGQQRPRSARGARCRHAEAVARKVPVCPPAAAGSVVVGTERSTHRSTTPQLVTRR